MLPFKDAKKKRRRGFQPAHYMALPDVHLDVEVKLPDAWSFADRAGSSVNHKVMFEKNMSTLSKSRTPV
jgi:hypothetical protein